MIHYRLSTMVGVVVFLLLLLITGSIAGCNNDAADDSDDDDNDSVDDDDDVDDDDGFDEALIPAGSYLMGCNEAVDSECQEDEYPQHEVYISAFYMGVYEITNQQYADYLKEFNPENICDEATNYFNCIAPVASDEKGIRLDNGIWVVDSGYEQHPAINVSWDGAVFYCEAYGRRLPTEAEWEKVTRLAVDMDGNKYSFLYPWGNFWEPNRANWIESDDPYEDGPFPRTTPVGFFSGALQDGYPTSDGRSPFGVHDMAGNVREWVSDWYTAGYYQSSPFSDPQGPDYPNPPYNVHVQRGGFYGSPEQGVRASIRYSSGIESSTGFRCARDIN